MKIDLNETDIFQTEQHLQDTDQMNMNYSLYLLIK